MTHVSCSVGEKPQSRERSCRGLVLGETLASALSSVQETGPQAAEHSSFRVGRRLINAWYNIVWNLLRPVLPLLSKLLSQRLVFV